MTTREMMILHGKSGFMKKSRSSSPDDDDDDDSEKRTSGMRSKRGRLAAESILSEIIQEESIDGSSE
jgi:hypothetical protein